MSVGQHGSSVVWVNGPFGVGKTSVVELACRTIPDAHPFDPEEVGFMLRKFAEPPSGDFQDLPAWRHLVVETIVAVLDHHALGSSGHPTLWIPMTLTNPRYRGDIFSGLSARGVGVTEFVLCADRDVIAKRIRGQVIHPGDPDRDDDVREWRLSRLDPVLAEIAELPRSARIIDNTHLHPADIVAAVTAALAAPGGGR